MTERADHIELTYEGREVCVTRDLWPPAWNIDDLSPEVSAGIIRWFKTTADQSLRSVTPIEIVLQMVFIYLRLSDGHGEANTGRPVAG